MKKICTKCLKEKDIKEFPVDIHGKYGHKSICKKCINKYNIGRRKGLDEKQALETLGGYIIYILNHPKTSEDKYNCFDVVNNKVYLTSNKSDFFNYLRGILND